MATRPSTVGAMMPHADPALERSLLASLVVASSNDLIADTLGTLPPRGFSVPEHEQIAHRLARLASLPEPVTAAVLATETAEETRCSWDDAWAAVRELVSDSGASTSPGVIASHVTRLTEMSRARDVDALVRENVAALGAGTPATDVAANLASTMLQYVASGSTTTGMEPGTVESMVEQYFDTRDKLDRGETPMSLSTGSADLDDALGFGGLLDGKVTVLAARPGVGKTAVAIDMMRAVLNQKRGVLFFSLEMPQQALFERFLAREARVPLSNLYRPSAEEDERLANAAHRLLGEWSPYLRVRHWPTVSLDQYRAETTRMKTLWERQGIEPGLVVYDYFQRTRLDMRGASNEVAAQTKLSKEMGTLTRETDIHLLLLSQINREGADRPTLNDLKGTGSLEEDADTVIILHRDQDPESPDANQIEYRIAKARSGPLSTVTRACELSTMTFRDIARGSQPAAGGWGPVAI